MTEVSTSAPARLVPGARTLTLPEVRARVPKSVATIYRWMKEGRFPQQIPLGPNSVVWLESEIDQFIAERSALRSKI